jgi:hypothetical protein
MKYVIEGLIVISTFLMGCSTPEVDIGKILIVIDEPYTVAKKN